MSIQAAKLGEVVIKAQSGFASGAKDEAGLAQIRMNNITTEGDLDLSSIRRIPHHEVKNAADFILHEGDVLFNSTNSSNLVGKTALFREQDEPFVFSNHFLRLVVNGERLDSRYLARWLTYQQQQGVFELLCTKWVNQAAVRRDDLLALKIPLPSLPEQHRIAAILDAADALRAKRRAALVKLDALGRAVFLEIFGEVRGNTKGWDVRKLGEVGALERGKSKHRPRNAPELLGGPYPLIQTGDVARADGGYILDYFQTYSEVGLKQSKLWKAGVLCITIAANIAESAILTFDACFPDSVVGFQAGKEVTTEYVQYWLGFLKESIRDNAPQVAQKNINLEFLRGIDIPLPPFALQEHFSRAVTEIARLRGNMRQSGRTYDRLFLTLQQRAFRGEL